MAMIIKAIPKDCVKEEMSFQSLNSDDIKKENRVDKVYQYSSFH